MTRDTEQTSRFGRSMGTLAVLGLVISALAALLQMLVPAVLLRIWPDSSYALVIAIQGICAYVSVADAGIQNSLTHRLTVLMAAGSVAEAKRLARGGLRALFLLAAVGVGAVIGIAATAGTLLSDRNELLPTPESAAAAFLALCAQAVSVGSALSLSGWSTAVEYAQHRYARAQTLGFLRAVLATAALVGSALLDQSAPFAVIASAVAAIAVDAVRFASSIRFVLGERGPPQSLRSFLWQSRSGPVYSLSVASSNGLLPAVVSMLAPAAAAAAVPGRTAANGARLVSTGIGNSIWVPLAARMELLRGEPAERGALWERVAVVLAALQCMSVAALVLAAAWVVPVWVPDKAPVILASLPLFLMEQCVLVAVGPTQVLLLASGKFAALGAAGLASTFVTLLVTLVLLPGHGAAGFAGGLAVGAVLVLLPASLWLEYDHWRTEGVRPVLGRRLALTALAVAAVGFMRAAPLIASTGALLAISGSLFVVFQELRALRASAPSTTNA